MLQEQIILRTIDTDVFSKSSPIHFFSKSILPSMKYVQLYLSNDSPFAFLRLSASKKDILALE